MAEELHDAVCSMCGGDAMTGHDFVPCEEARALRSQLAEARQEIARLMKAAEARADRLEAEAAVMREALVTHSNTHHDCLAGDVQTGTCGRTECREVLAALQPQAGQRLLDELQLFRRRVVAWKYVAKTYKKIADSCASRGTLSAENARLRDRLRLAEGVVDAARHYRTVLDAEVYENSQDMLDALMAAIAAYDARRDG